MKKILIIAPHPDDETLGVGGTILKHKNNGDEIHWLLITNVSKDNGWTSKQIKQRQLDIDTVGKTYGFKSINKLDFPTIKLDTIPMYDLVSKISNAIDSIKPNIIYTNNANDIHTDHQVTFQAVLSSTKNFRAPYIEKILVYETISETEFAVEKNMYGFQPNVFTDVTNYFDIKCRIMKIYSNELMKSPLPRSIRAIKALGKYRGSRIGVNYAESFMLVYQKN